MAETLADALNKPKEATLDNSTGALSGAPGPSSPLQATGQGAGPDAAKMAGTKIQKKAAQLAQTRQQDRSQQMGQQDRTEQARSERSEAEELASKRAAQLEQFGSLGSRIQETIQAQVSAGIAEDASVNVTEGEKLGSAFANLDDQTQKDSLAAINRFLQTNDPEELATLQNTKDANGNSLLPSPLTDQSIAALIGGIEQATGTSIAQMVGDNITVADLTSDQLTAMGLEDINELAQVLGVTPEQAQAMPMSEIVSTIEQIQGAAYSQVQQIQQQLADPAVPAAEKAMLREQLRDLGGVGLTGVEADIDSLAQAVQQAGTIQVNGQEMTLEEFLSDDKFSAMVTRSLTEPAGPDRKELERILGADTVAMLDQHRGAIKELVSGASEAATEYEELQEGLNKSRAALDATGVDSEVLEELLPGYTEASASASPDWLQSDMYTALAGDPTDPATTEAVLDAIFGEDGYMGADTATTMIKDLELLSKGPKNRIGVSVPNAKSRKYAEKLKVLKKYLDTNDDGLVDEKDNIKQSLIDTLKKEGASGVAALKSALKNATMGVSNEAAGRRDRQKEKLAASARYTKGRENFKGALDALNSGGSLAFRKALNLPKEPNPKQGFPTDFMYGVSPKQLQNFMAYASGIMNAGWKDEAGKKYMIDYINKAGALDGDDSEWNTKLLKHFGVYDKFKDYGWIKE